MREPEPQRRWWWNKRWWAAVVVWLVIAYPLSLGPLVYVIAREWITPSVAGPLLFPAQLIVLIPGAESAVKNYVLWWSVKAWQDEGRSVEILPDGTVFLSR